MVNVEPISKFGQTPARIVIATGTKPREAIPGALTFGADVRGESFRVLVDEIRRETVHKVVFALPGGTAWSLPIAFEVRLEAHSKRS
jgi:hypothetical protein